MKDTNITITNLTEEQFDKLHQHEHNVFKIKRRTAVDFELLEEKRITGNLIELTEQQTTVLYSWLQGSIQQIEEQYTIAQLKNGGLDALVTTVKEIIQLLPVAELNQDVESIRG